jgi:KDO2-lipid IV(A) lauroyltransferase
MHSTETPRLATLAHPRQWPVWLGVGLGRIAARLPYAWQMACGRLIGQLALHLMPHRRHVARVNLSLCFPELSDGERLQLLRDHFGSLGIGLVETAMAWWAPEHRLHSLARVQGLEHLHNALRGGRGVILLSAHFTTLELGGRLLAMRVPFHVLYRQHKNPLFEYIMEERRRVHFERAIPRSDMRSLLLSLKNNMPVWYAPDQNYGREQSVFAPFFGIPAATITATARVARASGAAVVPFFPERLPDNGGYQLTLYPALSDFPSGNDSADARRINAVIERAIREMPAQYLWAHRRFKTRPPGQPDVYA